MLVVEIEIFYPTCYDLNCHQVENYKFTYYMRQPEETLELLAHTRIVRVYGLIGSSQI